ncbi:MAG: TatD family hydrolase [Methanobrevibacter sp.]|jgi:TatD DNase family protein|nr:TatD family hydrolase [Candidatus Methanoflexus mossambicus]
MSVIQKKYIDIGINLLHKSFNNDRIDVINEGYKLGVSKLILTGTTVDNSLKTLNFVNKFNNMNDNDNDKNNCNYNYDKLNNKDNVPIIYSTAGIHPHNAIEFNENSLNSLEKIAKSPNVKAIGECGLDYNRDFSPRDIQREVFEKQIQLAIKLDMPLFLHDRESCVDFSKILEKYQEDLDKFVVHCFTGTKEELEIYLDLGAYVGITGWICDERRGKNLLKLINDIPLDKLMIETDAPFLIPRNLDPKPKKHRNLPKYLPHIAKTIAIELGEDEKKISEVTYKNTVDFFNL